MKKLLFLTLFSLLLTSCIFNLTFDDKYRVDVRVTATRLRTPLNVGDTLFFSAQLKNPVEVIDRSRNNDKFNVTFPDSTILRIGLSLRGPLIDNALYPEQMSKTQLDSTFRFFAEAGSINVIQNPVVSFQNSPDIFRLNFGIIMKKPGLYTVSFERRGVMIPSFSGEFYCYFNEKSLNHDLLNESQKNFLSIPYHGDNVAVFRVR